MESSRTGWTISRKGRALIPILLGCVVGPYLFSQSSEPSRAQRTYRVDVRTIQVPLTVLDSSGHLLTQLNADDFKLFEDGRPQNIRSLTVDTHDVNVVLLLDLSRSVKSQLKNIKHAARRFIDALGREDKVAVIAFSQDVTLMQDWTANKKKLRRAVNRLRPGTFTQLYDAIQLAVGQYLTGIPDKKAIVLITDGVDAVSMTSYKKLRETILRHQASIYIISLLKSVKHDMARYRRVAFIAKTMEKLGEKDYLETFFKGKEEEMSRLANSTGGRAFYPSNISAISGIYEQVARELKSQFLLTYIPTNPSPGLSYRKILLKYREPDSEVFYRQGYFPD